MPFFCDSNIIVYAFSKDPKRERAIELLVSGPDINVQVLNEFANVSRRKLMSGWDTIREALDLIQLSANAVHPLTQAVHSDGLYLAEHFKFQLYDAMIVSAALTAKCETLYSEDMQDGMVIDNRLTIRNPFV